VAGYHSRRTRTLLNQSFVVLRLSQLGHIFAFVFFGAFQVHVFLCFRLSAPAQYRSKTRRRNDLLCIEWDIKPYCIYSLSCLQGAQLSQRDRTRAYFSVQLMTICAAVKCKCAVVKVNLCSLKFNVLLIMTAAIRIIAPYEKPSCRKVKLPAIDFRPTDPHDARGRP